MKVSENKNHSVHLRLTDSQYEFCQLNAELMGVGVADFIRMSINSLCVASEKLTESVSKKLSANTLGDLENADNKDNI